jgi:predicted aspartyl protease
MPHLSVPTKPRGPVLDVTIAVSIPRQQNLHRSGFPIPTPFAARALIDTGATQTCVDPAVTLQLGLNPAGTVKIHTPSAQGVGYLCNVYDVCVEFPTSPGLPFRILSMPVVESSLSVQSIDALIGRDVLEHATMFYDGASGRVTISF